MTCQHDKAKWVVYQPDGGVVALDDDSGCEHHATVEWCSECGSLRVGHQWIQPGSREPPWLQATNALVGVTLDIDHWSKEPRHKLTSDQIDNLSLAKDHICQAQDFLGKAFGVMRSEPPPAPPGLLESSPPPPAE